MLVLERISKWVGSDVCVVLLGDFFQLPPTKGASLTTVATESIGSSSTSVLQKSAELFTQFTRVDFTIQQRSIGDKSWTYMIEKVRRDKRYADDVVSRMQTLSYEDVNKDAKWHDAVIGCEDNKTRAELNLSQAIRFAKRHNEPVIRWRKPLSIAIHNMLTPAEIETLYVDEALLSGIFVRGAPAMILKNESTTATAKGIMNGASVTMHSLVLTDLKNKDGSFDPNSDAVIQRDAFLQQLQSARAGEIVELNGEPLFINVAFQPTSPDALLDGETIRIGDKFIFPVRKTFRKDFRVYVSGRK